MNQQNSIQNETNPGEKKSTLQVIVHSFFVVPFLIAIFSVIIFLVIRIITAEPRTAQDYLNDVKIGGTTKRWQGAFELSKILTNPSLIPTDERFKNELVSAFEYSEHDRDTRIRQYLALAMGRTGDQDYVSTLLTGLDDEDPNTVASCVYALGLLRSEEALESLLTLREHPSSQVRLQTVIALGNLNSNQVVPFLEEKLHDPEPNIRWDAAIGLAKRGNNIGRRIILDLLNRNYLDSFPNIDEIEQVQAMSVAIQIAPLIQDSEIEQSLIFLRDNDSNMKIREAARKALEHFN